MRIAIIGAGNVGGGLGAALAGFENLTTARGRHAPAAMFVAGDDPEAKRVAMDLASELGFVAEDAGGLANAKTLEGMVRIWLAIAQVHGRGVGFAISLD